jgi:hypothetical protein
MSAKKTVSAMTRVKNKRKKMHHELRILRSNSAEAIAQNAMVGRILCSIRQELIDAVTHYMGTHSTDESNVALGEAVTEDDIRCASEHAQAASQALQALGRALYHPIKRFGTQEKQLETILRNVEVDAININDSAPPPHTAEDEV